MFGPFYLGDANDEERDFHNGPTTNGRRTAVSGLPRDGAGTGRANHGRHDRPQNAGQALRDLPGHRQIDGVYDQISATWREGE